MVEIPDLKQLQAFLKLCRKQGVSKVTLGDLAIEFGDLPYDIKGGERVASEEDAQEMSPEDLVFYSAQPNIMGIEGQ